MTYLNPSQPSDPRDEEARLLAAVLREDSGADDRGEIGSILGLISDSLRFRSRLVVIVSSAVMVGLLALAVWSAVRFFQVPDGDVRGLVLYATLFLFAATQVPVMKVWFWINWNRNSVIREIKRLELRLTAATMRRD